MTSIPATNSALTQGTPSAAATAAADGTLEESLSGSTNADFDDFLTLLVSQMRNQDPLNPADGTEFVAQLAQFSSLEQQIATVDKLDQLIALQSGSSLVELSSWIGQTVSAPAEEVRYSGEPIDVALPGEPGATAAQLVVRGQNGAEVAALNFDPSGETVTWDGKDSSGAEVPQGDYRLEVIYTVNGGNGPETLRRDYVPTGQVVEARLDGAEQQLILDNGAIINPNNVRSLTATPETTLVEDAVDTVGDVVDAAVDLI